MTYGLECSEDGVAWRAVTEKRSRLDRAGGGLSAERVTRARIEDIQREAEFHSHRFPHVRIIHP